MADEHLRLVILVDNKGCGGLVEEHGFAAWVESGGRTLLFDTGQGAALVANAAALGCDLAAIDALVLSHGHYDHAGTVAHVLRRAAHARVYAHAGALVTRYSVRPGEPPRTIGMAGDDREAILALPPARLHWVDGPCVPAPGMTLSGPIPRQHPLEDSGGPFFLDPDGEAADPLDDDLALWIETPRGLLLLVGCCHAGLINTVAHARAVSGIDRIFGIIGGLHLVNASSERLAATCAALRGWEPAFVVPCHCSGDGAVAALAAALGERVVSGYTGLTLTLTANGLDVAGRKY
ncbi:MAG: MBL fold metallo-hydrolase [Deltaproteobacteria bacterium]|nr:MAG: MBL fold metallo-hydrolase [Deltaproteobacteria bacterium]